MDDYDENEQIEEDDEETPRTKRDVDKHEKDEKDDEDLESEEEDLETDDESEQQSEPENTSAKGILPRFDDDEEEEEDEHYLQKFDEHVKNDVISNFHPEMQNHNFEEVQCLCTVVRNSDGVVIDQLHRTLPFITKYEKARVLGERAKQLNSGAKSFIEVEPNMIDGYLIALKEFEQKKIPFILRRPLPNGGCEYWRLSDLEHL